MGDATAGEKFGAGPPRLEVVAGRGLGDGLMELYRRHESEVGGQE